MTIPLPITVPIPWPQPAPGVGTPVPSPSPGTAFPTLPGPPTGIGVPIPTSDTPTGVGDAFGKLFAFTLDAKFLAAFLFMALTVWLVDSQYPEYVWLYVAILLGGLVLVNNPLANKLRAATGV